MRARSGLLHQVDYDYKRHGTTTLFAAFNVLDGTVIGQNMQRHRHQEFIRFLNAINAKVPADKAVHIILDNYAAHKHPDPGASDATRHLRISGTVKGTDLKDEPACQRGILYRIKFSRDCRVRDQHD
jgi:transposase